MLRLMINYTLICRNRTFCINSKVIGIYNKNNYPCNRQNCYSSRVTYAVKFSESVFKDFVEISLVLSLCPCNEYNMYRKKNIYNTSYRNLTTKISLCFNYCCFPFIISANKLNFVKYNERI